MGYRIVRRIAEIVEQLLLGTRESAYAYSQAYKSDEWADKDKSLLEMNPVITRSACPSWQSIEAWGIDMDVQS